MITGTLKRLKRRLAERTEFEFQNAAVRKQGNRIEVQVSLRWPLIPKRIELLSSAWSQIRSGVLDDGVLEIWLDPRSMPAIDKAEATLGRTQHPIARLSDSGVEWIIEGFEETLQYLLEYSPPRNNSPFPHTDLIPSWRPWIEVCRTLWVEAFRRALMKDKKVHVYIAAILASELEFTELVTAVEGAIERGASICDVPMRKALSRLREPQSVEHDHKPYSS